ncbi:MAG: TonB-dependent receptor [Ignavibacteriae bacterium]|nr:TonB-dependent receptor [Ignavibacteriota bacterium]
MKLTLLLLVTAFLFPGQASAQTGAVSGIVVDKSTLEPLPSAAVQILGSSLGASSNEEGKFTITGIPFGTYQVRASIVGYEPEIISDVVVASGRKLDLRFELHESAIGLEGVEVRANYFQKSPDAPVSIQKLSYEEIRRSPGGFEDVIRAISVLPGVAQVQSGRNDLVVRGGAPSENLFTVDNIEIPNINHFGTQGSSGGPLSFINLDFVRETSFSTGGFGVRYGDRLSSVLNITLRDGRSDRLGGKATISATQFGLNLEGPVGSSGTFLFSARRSYLDFIFKAAGFSFVPEYWDFLGRANYSIDAHNEVTFLAVGAIDDVSWFDRDADDRFKNSRVLGTDQRQYASGFSWRNLFSHGFASLTLSRSSVTYDGLQRDSLLNPIFMNRSKEGETGLRADIVYKVSSSIEMSAGASVKNINFTSNLALPGYVTTFGDTLDVQVNDYASRATKASSYVQASGHPLDRLTLTLGGRLDYFDLIEQKATFAPRGSLGYEITPLTSASASIGRYYQSPSYIWLVSNPANRDLKPIAVDQYILGVEHLLQADLKVRVEGFLKRYADYPASVDRPYLVLANTGGGFEGSDDNFASFGLDRLVSGGKGRAYGIELLVQKKLSDSPVYGLASLTLARSRFTALDGVERSGTFEQDVIVNLSGGYMFDENWSGSMKFRFATGRPYTPFTSTGTQNVAEYNARNVDPLHSLDVRVERRWNFDAWNLIAYIDIQNIYNYKNTGSVRWNAREQKVEINNSSIGILPSIGVSAEF